MLNRTYCTYPIVKVKIKMKNVKRNVYVIMLFLLVSMLVVGCIGSNKMKNVSQEQASSPQSILGVYQDLAWKKNFEQNSHNIDVDLQNIQTSEKTIQIDKKSNLTSEVNFNTDLLVSSEQTLVNDAQDALNESNNFTVSPKYQEAQKEWELALQDYYNGGNYLIIVANEGEIGKVNPEESKNGQSLLNSAENHKKKAFTLVT